MDDSGVSPLVLAEGRFDRLEAVEWWDQDRLRASRVLVVGAGALGNELLKNLALLGIGRVVVVDKDVVEKSNLSRSILFREADEGRPKAECAAAAVTDICPETKVRAIVGDVTADLGLGWFRWADVVAGALDNREARVFVNAACAQFGKTWIDGGIEVLTGIVRGFSPPKTACYECTMGRADWDAINQRRSCSLLARRAAAGRGTPTTPTTASVIGGMQAQEIVKIIHGLTALEGRGFFFDGLKHSSYPIVYPVNPDCAWHEPPIPVEVAQEADSDTPLGRLAERAAGRLGGLDALDLPREIVRRVECPECGWSAGIWLPLEKVTAGQAVCGECGGEVVPEFIHSIGPDGGLLERTPRQIGLPLWDVVWARYGEKGLGLEIGGDRPAF